MCPTDQGSDQTSLEIGFLTRLGQRAVLANGRSATTRIARIAAVTSPRFGRTVGTLRPPSATQPMRSPGAPQSRHVGGRGGWSPVMPSSSFAAVNKHLLFGAAPRIGGSSLFLWVGPVKFRQIQARQALMSCKISAPATRRTIAGLATNHPGGHRPMLTPDETGMCTAIPCVVLADGSGVGRVASLEPVRVAATATAGAAEALV